MTKEISQKDWQLISEYLDGQLSAKKRTRFEARLKSNTQLLESLEEIRRTRSVIRRQSRVRAPRNFTLVPGMVSKQQIFRPYPVFQFAAVMASLVLIFVVLGDVFFGRTSLINIQTAYDAAPELQLRSDVSEEVEMEALVEEAASLPPAEKVQEAVETFAVEPTEEWIEAPLAEPAEEIVKAPLAGPTEIIAEVPLAGSTDDYLVEGEIIVTEEEPIFFGQTQMQPGVIIESEVQTLETTQTPSMLPQATATLGSTVIMSEEIVLATSAEEHNFQETEVAILVIVPTEAPVVTDEIQSTPSASVFRQFISDLPSIRFLEVTLALLAMGMWVAVLFLRRR